MQSCLSSTLDPSSQALISSDESLICVESHRTIKDSLVVCKTVDLIVLKHCELTYLKYLVKII